MRTTDGTLHFLVNGVDQGPAANGIAAKVYAVIDMYGKCAQVTIVDNAPGTNQENGMYIVHSVSNNPCFYCSKLNFCVQDHPKAYQN